MSGPIRTPEEALAVAAELLQQRGSKLRRMGATDDFDLLRDMAWQVRALSSRIPAPAPSPLEEIGEAAIAWWLAEREADREADNSADWSPAANAATYQRATDLEVALCALIDAEIARRAYEDAADTILASGGLTAEGGLRKWLADPEVKAILSRDLSSNAEGGE
jgi:hypothetical protein